MSKGVQIEGIDGYDGEFRAALLKRRDELEEERVDKEIQIEEWQKRLEWLDEQIDHIEALLEPVTQTADTSPRLMPDVPQGKNKFADAVVNLIRENGAPMHYREIHEALRHKGVDLPEGKDPATTLLARYYDDERLYRPKRGTYAVGDRRRNRSVGVRQRKTRRGE